MIDYISDNEGIHFEKKEGGINIKYFLRVLNFWLEDFH
jgi:hypothetical protein